MGLGERTDRAPSMMTCVRPPPAEEEAEAVELEQGLGTASCAFQREAAYCRSCCLSEPRC